VSASIAEPLPAIGLAWTSSLAPAGPAGYAAREPMRVAILMPVFNEPGRLARTLGGVRGRAEALGGVTVFLVDDGSEPAIDPADLPAPAPGFRVVLARHAVNLGQGAALETARQIALGARPFAVYATMDSDGQHRVEDVAALAAAIDAGADVALGDRFRGDSNVPPARRALIACARLFERALTGLRLSDAHNGLRAFSRRALAEVQIHQNRMAHATEITRQISAARAARDLVVVEVPVSVRYSRETLRKGQASLGAFAILRDLFYRYLFEEAP
jgi:glycosyltransferase involved in cell wall biosynthesis